MMNCKDAQSFADSWENGEVPAGLEEFKAHLDECSRCSGRLAALIPLIERDLAPCTVPAPAPAGLADGVMAAISSGSGNRSASPAFHPLFAAAAAAIFIAGLSLGVFFSGRNATMATVKFILDAPQASAVYLAGDFNAWDGESYRMRRVGTSGRWEISIKLQKNKVYVYNFVLDGKTWIADPAVSAKIDDGFGGNGSLLRI